MSPVPVNCVEDEGYWGEDSYLTDVRTGFTYTNVADVQMIAAFGKDRTALRIDLVTEKKSQIAYPRKDQ